jgi:hypothetical protein
MAIICRTDLKNYALRALGAPVLQINVTPDQVEDRIDDAIELYWEHHHEGSFRDYISIALTQAQIDSGEIELDEWVYTVLGVVTLGGQYSETNLEYQSYMQSFGSLVTPSPGSLLSYTLALSRRSLLDFFFSRGHVLSFNQRHDKVRFHSSLSDLDVGDIIVLEVYRLSDPETYRETYKDPWLRDYTIAQIKKQWGQNMLKYEGFQLPNGMTMNGRQIYEDALRDIEELRRRLFEEETFPVDFFVG